MKISELQAQGKTVTASPPIGGALRLSNIDQSRISAKPPAGPGLGKKIVDYGVNAFKGLAAGETQKLKEAGESIKKVGEAKSLGEVYARTGQAMERGIVGPLVPAAEFLFKPVADVIQLIGEGVSEIPAVQRAAMSESVGNVLGKIQSGAESLEELKKNNPDIAPDVENIANLALVLFGRKPAKAVIKRTADGAVEVVTRGREAASQARRGAEELIGKSERESAAVLSGKAAKGEDIAPIFKKYGISPPVSAVTRSRAIQSTEAILQSAWFGGSKISSIVDETRNAIFKITESLKKNVDPEALKSGVTNESVGVAMKDALEATKKAFNDAKNKIYEDATSQIGKQQAVLDETRKVLAEIVAQKKASADPGSRAQAKYYEKFLGNLSNAQKRTFENVKQTRSDVGRKMGDRTDPISTGDRANIGRLYSAISKDLDSTVSKSGEGPSLALKQADAFYKAGVTRINSFVGRTILRSKSPERILTALVKPGDVTVARELRGLIGEDAFRQVGSALMNNIIEAAINPLTQRLIPSKIAAIMAKYGDDMLREILGEKGLQQLKDLRKSAIVDDILEKGTTDGRVQPGRLAAAIEKYDEKVLKEAFAPEELVKLRDAQKMAAALQKGTKILEGSPTAEKGQHIINIMTGLGLGVGTLAAKIGVEWGLSKMFTSGWGRRLLTGGRLRKGGKTGAPVAPGAKGGANVEEAVNAQPGAKQGGSSTFRYSEKEETGGVLREAKKRRKPADTQGGFVRVPGFANEKSLFKGINPLTTKLLEKFKGMPDEITPQQFNEVINKAQKEGIKKVDLDMVREAAERQMGNKLYHGTSADDFSKFKGDVVYLVDDPKEAEYFSKSIAGGSGKNTGSPRVLSVQTPTGKKKDITKMVDDIIAGEEYTLDMDLDSVIAEEALKAKKEGFEYLTFRHPSAYKDADFTAVVSVNPSKLKLGEPKIFLPTLAKDVQTQLVPLTPTPVKSPRWANVGEDFIGDGKYGEIVYQSPIKTSAGELHYPGIESRYSPGGYKPTGVQKFPNYFSHVRYEDQGTTRKLMEVQSDLMQKENFAREVSFADENLEYLREHGVQYKNPEQKLTIPKLEARQKELSKLKNYESNDPLAHLRTFREEVKRAAKDGKDTLLIPSGETAMKIEGLGETAVWMRGHSTERFTPQTLKIGDEAVMGQPSPNGVYRGEGDTWIITDILGDGKFKAISKDKLEDILEDGGIAADSIPVSQWIDEAKNMSRFKDTGNTETFDISGKVDTQHFVYKLNEEAIPKEARKQGLIVEGKISQDNGEWWKIKIPKERAKMSVEAFGVVAPIAIGEIDKRVRRYTK